MVLALTLTLAGVREPGHASRRPRRISARRVEAGAHDRAQARGPRGRGAARHRARAGLARAERTRWVPIATARLPARGRWWAVSVFQTRALVLAARRGARAGQSSPGGSSPATGPPSSTAPSGRSSCSAGWLGVPMLLAFAIGCGVALWGDAARTSILMAFLVPAFLAAAAIPWMDDRFFVYLVPPAAVAVLPAAWCGAVDARRRTPARALAIVGAGARAPGRGSRTVGLAGRAPEPPDTRALAQAGGSRLTFRARRAWRWRDTSRSGSTSGRRRRFFDPGGRCRKARAAADVARHELPRAAIATSTPA